MNSFEKWIAFRTIFVKEARRFLRIFLDALGAVPIRRRKDHGGERIDNSDAFERLYAVLSGSKVKIPSNSIDR